MKGLLHKAKAASEEAAAAGLNRVPAAIAEPIAKRYDEILTQALLRLPADVPPRKKHSGGWTNAEREAWNLATVRHEAPCNRAEMKGLRRRPVAAGW